jgi:putative ABC transport system permease protein
VHYPEWMFGLLIEDIKVAWQSVRTHLLRSILTVLIIAIGITALVGILTAVDALKNSIGEQFATLGANSFSIVAVNFAHKTLDGKRLKPQPPIKFREAAMFKELFEERAVVSVACRPTGIAIARYKDEETNPNITVFGTDENYLKTNGYELESGRNFSKRELESDMRIAVIGSEIKELLFQDRDKVVGEIISVNNLSYTVIGVLKEKGSSIGFSGDRNILIPLLSARQYFSYPGMAYTISVSVPSPELLNEVVNDAEGVFRGMRKDDLKSESSFLIRRSDSISEQLISNLSMVTLVAAMIAVITLFGAAIGLMNIMLVSVTERTREIGIRKAIGARITAIRNQFLTEAILICAIGGVSGIILGIAIGNVVSLAIGTSFFIPWLWIFLGIVLSLFVGITAGYYPARKASLLDPIESLRYE